jgi:hypothetical protein
MIFGRRIAELPFDLRSTVTARALSPQDLESKTFCLRVFGASRNGKLSYINSL